MKKIETVIQSHKANAVQQALSDNGITRVTLLFAKEIEKEKTITQIYRGITVPVGFVQMTKIEVIVPDSLAQTAITTIVNVTRGRNNEDPVIFVSNIEAVHLRTIDAKEVVEEMAL